MKLNDDILRSAATMLRDEKLEALSDENEYSAHIFSDEFEQEMQEFIEKVKPWIHIEPGRCYVYASDT